MENRSFSPAFLASLRRADGWRLLNPRLSICADDSPMRAWLDDAVAATVSEDLHREGYFTLPALIPAAEVARLRAGIETLVAAGLPPVTCWIYDAYWRVFAGLLPLLRRYLGSQVALLPHLWAWHVAPGPAHAGWPPHRDYQGPSALDDTLISLSLWLPLTPADPDNGCMYVLPRGCEAAYDSPVSDPGQVRLQDIRALPAAPGAVLGWRQDLYHWGARSSARARGPRISLSLEFQNPAFAPLAAPLLDVAAPPNFAERLALVAGQLGKYAHMQAPPPGAAVLAAALGHRVG